MERGWSDSVDDGLVSMRSEVKAVTLIGIGRMLAVVPPRADGTFIYFARCCLSWYDSRKQALRACQIVSTTVYHCIPLPMNGATCKAEARPRCTAISSANSVHKREAVLGSVLSSRPSELSRLRSLRACVSTNTT